MIVVLSSNSFKGAHFKKKLCLQQPDGVHGISVCLMLLKILKKSRYNSFV